MRRIKKMYKVRPHEYQIGLYLNGSYKINEFSLDWSWLQRFKKNHLLLADPIGYM